MIFYSRNSVFWFLIILFIFFNNRFSNSKKRRPFLILQTKQSPLRSSFQVKKKNHTKPTKPSVFSLSHPPQNQNKQVVLWTAKLITSGVRKTSAYPSTLASPSGFSLYVLMCCADAHAPPPPLFFPSPLLATPQMHLWLLISPHSALVVPCSCVPCALLLGLAAPRSVPGQLISAALLWWGKCRGFRVACVFTAVHLWRKSCKK